MRFTNLLRYFIFAMILTILVIFDSAFFPGLGTPWSVLSITFLSSLYLATVLQIRLALLLYLSATFLLAFFSRNAFLIPFLIGTSVIYLTDLLLNNVFTNRSYYVVVLIGLIGWLSYGITTIFLFWVQSLTLPNLLSPMIQADTIIQLFKVLPIVFLLFSVGYALTTFFSKRFKSYFILQG